MNSNLAKEDQTPDTVPGVGGAWSRWWPMLLILAAALSYYGSYWQYWFNPHDEGGTVCLGAQRLLQGERPWVDVELGYNIGWFYPLVALFKITGVNYLAARAWFFALSTGTALLGYLAVKRASGSRWLGLGAGLALVALPGSQFKNYIQLSEAANTACLIHLLFVDPTQRRRWFGSLGLGGVVLGLTYLLRIELGFFFTVIWAGLLLLVLLDRRLTALRRLACVFGGLLAFFIGFAAAQAPAYLDMRSRGLENVYLSKYSSWFDFLETSLRQQVAHFTKRNQPEPVAPALAALAPAALPTPTPAPAAPAPEIEVAAVPDPTTATPTSPSLEKSATLAAKKPLVSDDTDAGTLGRKPLQAIWKKGANSRDRMLGFLTYAPFVGFGIFLAIGFLGFLAELFRGRFTLGSVPLRWLLLCGGSLTTFPQFFFFRPDRPHLSEFMTGYVIAMAASLWLLWPHGPAAPKWRRAFAGLVGLFLVAQIAIFAVFAMQHPSAGTIAARKGRKSWFQGENGVHLRVSKKERAELQGIHDTVLQHSGPQDYLIAFPYMPGYNLMTNRRTYLRDVYVDNATRSSNWSADTIHDLEQRQPAVVIIADRAINGRDSSRFSRWAATVYAFLQEHYVLAKKYDEVEVYVRPPASNAPVAAPAVN